MNARDAVKVLKCGLETGQRSGLTDYYEMQLVSKDIFPLCTLFGCRITTKFSDFS